MMQDNLVKPCWLPTLTCSGVFDITFLLLTLDALLYTVCIFTDLTTCILQTSPYVFCRPHHVSSGQPPAKHKLFVLFTAGKQKNKGKPILPKDAARLLKDIGVQIVVVDFDETDPTVAAVSSSPEDDAKVRGWFTQQSLWANICGRLKGLGFTIPHDDN